MPMPRSGDYLGFEVFQKRESKEMLAISYLVLQACVSFFRTNFRVNFARDFVCGFWEAFFLENRRKIHPNSKQTSNLNFELHGPKCLLFWSSQTHVVHNALVSGL